MAKLIKALIAVNGMDFEDCVSFETKNYIGIWSNSSNQFLLIEKSNSMFEEFELPICTNFSELEDAVYEICNEHILDVYKSNSYTITLDVRE